MTDVVTKHAHKPWYVIPAPTKNMLPGSMISEDPAAKWGDDVPPLGETRTAFYATPGIAEEVAEYHNYCAGINPKAVPKMLDLLRETLADYDLSNNDGSIIIGKSEAETYRELIALAEKQ